MISILVLINVGKNKFLNVSEYWPRHMFNFDFPTKGLGLASPSYFVYDFSRKLFLLRTFY